MLNAKRRYRSHARHATVANAHSESGTIEVGRLEALPTATYAELILDVDIASKYVAECHYFSIRFIKNKIPRSDRKTDAVLVTSDRWRTLNAIVYLYGTCVAHQQQQYGNNGCDAARLSPHGVHVRLEVRVFISFDMCPFLHLSPFPNQPLAPTFTTTYTPT